MKKKPLNRWLNLAPTLLASIIDITITIVYQPIGTENPWRAFAKRAYFHKHLQCDSPSLVYDSPTITLSLPQSLKPQKNPLQNWK